MGRWCLHLDKPINGDEGCTDEWGVHHSCKGCPHNEYIGNNSSNCLTTKNYGNC